MEWKDKKWNGMEGNSNAVKNQAKYKYGVSLALWYKFVIRPWTTFLTVFFANTLWLFTYHIVNNHEVCNFHVLLLCGLSIRLLIWNLPYTLDTFWCLRFGFCVINFPSILSGFLKWEKSKKMTRAKSWIFLNNSTEKQFGTWKNWRWQNWRLFGHCLEKFD